VITGLFLAFFHAAPAAALSAVFHSEAAPASKSCLKADYMGCHDQSKIIMRSSSLAQQISLDIFSRERSSTGSSDCFVVVLVVVVVVGIIHPLVI
jgi:urease accessory protein UreF